MTALPTPKACVKTSQMEHKVNNHPPFSRRKIGGIHGFALLLALLLFYFHVVVIFDVIGEMLRAKAWLLEHLGPHQAGKIILLGCFLALMLAHFAEAAVWGLFLCWTRQFPSEVGRIQERSDAAPAIDECGRLRVLRLPERRFAWSGLLCLG